MTTTSARTTATSTLGRVQGTLVQDFTVTATPSGDPRFLADPSPVAGLGPQTSARPMAPPREPSRVWWLPWFLGIIFLLGIFGVWQNSRPVTVSPPAPPATTNTPTPTSVWPSRECGVTLQFGRVIFRGDTVRLVGNWHHQWSDYTCLKWGPKSLVCDLKIASSDAATRRIWLVRGNGPRGPVTSIGRNPPESP
jgi:hypothetical protein